MARDNSGQLGTFQDIGMKMPDDEHLDDPVVNNLRVDPGNKSKIGLIR
jgi:hypothetical protein